MLTVKNAIRMMSYFFNFRDGRSWHCSRWGHCEFSKAFFWLLKQEILLHQILQAKRYYTSACCWDSKKKNTHSKYKKNEKSKKKRWEQEEVHKYSYKANAFLSITCEELDLDLSYHMKPLCIIHVLYSVFVLITVTTSNTDWKNEKPGDHVLMVNYFARLIKNPL